MKYTIKPEEAGKRMDVFLAAKMPEFSRSRVQKMIKAGEITLNGRAVAPHSFLKEKDEVRSLKARAKKKSAKKPEAAVKSRKYSIEKMILEDNDEFLVINKPAGIAVHGPAGLTASKELPDEISGLVRKKYPKISSVGDDPARPGIVHRLDKDVSGAMVIAKHDASFENLKAQFKKRQVKKNYLALVYGRIKKDQGIINFPIARSRDGKMAARPIGTPGKPAETEFKVLKRFINFTLAEARPKTGRTHQIRCHLAAYGYPIVGDNLYGTRPARGKNRKYGLRRIFLVSTGLSFKNLAGERLSFSVPLPEDMEDFMARQK